MATTENTTVLRIDGKPAVTSLRELKAAIEANKDALVQLGLVEDSDTAKKEKQAQITKQLENNLKLLNQVQNAAKVTTVQNAKAIDTQTASYYDMQKALSTLKKAWKEMDAEQRNATEGGEILQKIKQLDAELKTLDSDIGQFQRNVGNYGQSFKQSLDEAQKGAQGLVQGFSSVNGIMALTGESSNSLVKALAAVQVIAGLLNSSKGIVGFIKHLRETTAAEKATAAGAKATAGAMQAEAAATETATAATKVFKTALATIGIGAVLVLVGELIAHLDDLARTFGLIDEEAEKQHQATFKRIEELDAEIDKRKRLLEAAGESQSTVMLQNIKDIQDAAHEVFEEYSKFYDEYNDKTLVGQWASDLSDEKIEEMWEKHHDLVMQAKKAYDDLEVSVVSYIHSSDLERAQEGMNEYEKSIDNLKRTALEAAAELEALRAAGKITAEQFEQYSADLLDTFNWQADQVVKKAQEDRQREKERQTKAASDRLKAEKKNAENLLKQAEDARKTDLQRLTDKYNEEKAMLEKHGLDTAALTANYEEARAAIFKKSAAKVQAQLDKDTAEQEAKRKKKAEDDMAAARDAADAQLELLEKLAERRTRLSEATIDDEEKSAAATYEIEQQALRDRIDALEQFQAEALELGDQEAALQYQQEAADLSVEIELREAEEKARIRKRDKKNREQAAKETVASVSSILGALADIYEINGKEDAKAQKRAKNIRIAAATIDMIQGAVTAYSTAQSLGPIAGPIVGAINAAAVTAAGLENIAKIRATDVSGNSAPADSAAAPAIAEAPQVNPEVQVVRNLTGQSEEDRINQPQRVYILQSDIEAAGNQSRAVVAESTF